MGGTASSEASHPGFAFAGIDLVLSRDGRWFALEVNDHPSGLLEADQRSGTTCGMDALANTLARRASGGTVCLLLPDCFRVAGGALDSQVERLDTYLFDDARIRRTIDEFNALHGTLRERGAHTVIAGVDGVALEGREVTAGGEKVAALYRRAYRFPLTDTACACVNDVRLRAICPDKQRTAAVLRRSAAVRMPETFEGPPDAVTRERFAAEGKRFITKPNFGSGSAGVQRVAASDVAASDAAAGNAGNAWLYQEWIEPATLVVGGRDYHFDVRVYVVDGRVVSRIARRAAAPCDDARMADSPLTWLTTTGPWYALDSDASNEDVALPAEAIEELDDLCVTITRLLSEAASALDHDVAAASIRPFASLTGAKGALRTIEVGPA